MNSLQKPTIIGFDEAKAHIQALDLSYISDYMCAERYPLPRWNLADAVKCCQLYKNFLILIKKHSPEFLVPTREIDEFWHNHILYTKNYLRDSTAIFGHYLHHYPASPDENQQRMIDAYSKTKAYYLEEFKEPLETYT